MITSKNLKSLDIETSDVDPTRNSTFALEPWRVVSGEAEITSVAVAGPDGYMKQINTYDNSINELRSLINSLSGQFVVAHNAIFDIAWIICTLGEEGYSLCKKVKWIDSMLMAKWILNSQIDQHTSTALDSCVERFMIGHPMYQEFLDMKSEDQIPGHDKEYWLKRGRFDAEMTRQLALIMNKKLVGKMPKGFYIEQRILPTVANSWITGLNLDMQGMSKLANRIATVKKNILNKLDIPADFVESPTKLLTYLEGELNLVMPEKTPKGKGSTGQESLMKLHRQLSIEIDPRKDILKNILDYKKLHTTETKFVKGAFRATEYTKLDKSLSSPRIFGTYTGRFTYANKIKKKNQVGLATHQLPRKGPIRKLIVPPEGYKVMELDAAAQEMRFMGHFSRDEYMVNAFNQGIGLHSAMGADIHGIDYKTFEALFKEKDPDVTNSRYAGKLLNLSCQYRISGAALARKFFSTYEIVITPSKGKWYESKYRQRYPGVPKYWTEAIKLARQNGYAETIAGRRFGITKWSHNSWVSESSAINFPIQGSGADHKDAAIAYVAHKFPEVIFVLDLHDGLWYFIPEDHYVEHALEIRNSLNSLNFCDLWDVEHVVDFPFDVQVGDNFLDVKEL